MTLEQQVCSLELAKKLKELGVKQNGEIAFWWNNSLWDAFSHTIPSDGQWYSAFTVAELGEILPNGIACYRRSGYKKANAGRTDAGWSCIAQNYLPKNVPVQQSATEADARAKMLIYLVENKLIQSQ